MSSNILHLVSTHESNYNIIPVVNSLGSSMIELNLVEKYLLHKAKSLSIISSPINNNKQWLGFLFDGSKVA